MKYMKLVIPAFLTISILMSILLSSCGKKQTSASDNLVIGKDTVSITKLLELDPGSTDSSTILRNVMVRYFWKNTGAGKADDSIIRLFGERLLLVSGIEWDQSAGELLFQSAAGLAAMDTGRATCQSAATVADSFCRKAAVLLKGNVIVTCPDKKIPDLSTDCTSDAIRINNIVRYLGVQDDVARLLHEFLYKPIDTSSTAGAASVKKMVAGLVSNKTADSVNQRAVSAATTRSAVVKSAVPVVVPKKFNMEYRSEQSVRDSIARHIPEIRQLYKKYLKADASLAGNAVVTFQVASNGSVISAETRASNLGKSPFVNQFIAYCKMIKFKPAPENAGVMTFDFPFEFNAEM